MSYQAERYVCNLRGVSRGEKCVLWVVAHYLDHRTGIARIAQDNIGADAEMSERHVRRLTSALEARGLLAITRNRNGRGAVAEYRFPGMSKEDTVSAFSAKRRTCETGKEDIGARKADIRDTAIKEEEAREVEKENEENITPDGALKSWLAAKRQLQATLPTSEFDLWVRPMYLLRVLSNEVMLLALPPSTRVVSAARSYKHTLTELVQRYGFKGVAFTKYPDNCDIESLAINSPEWREVWLRFRRRYSRRKPVQAAG
jgi:hypothetical protein